MTTRMIHPMHGATHAYGPAEIAWHRERGWVVEHEVRQTTPALPGEGPHTPLAASTAVFNTTDQAVIARELEKRKPGRPPKAK